MEYSTVSFDDVLDYWVTFFPEKKESLSDIENVIIETTKKDFMDLKKHWDDSSRERALSEEWIDIILNTEENKKIENIIEKNYYDYDFIGVIKPFVNYHISVFLDEILKQEYIINFQNIVDCIFKNTYNDLYKIFYKTIIFEINIAREESKLKGDTTKERFLYFKDCLLKDKSYLRYLYLDYPHLFNLVDKRTFEVINFIITITKNTGENYKQLDAEFNNSRTLGKIEEIDLGQGDSHRGAKSVSLITFSSGYKLVYKPKEMMLEKKYNNFIKWLNSMKIKDYLELKTAKVYSTSACGWMEYIHYEELDDLKDASNYYYKIGQFLCLLYTFNSKDFHYENIIANKDNPILIDIETIFHGELNTDSNESSASVNAEKLINQSVCSIYLLPNRVTFANDDNGYFDFGGVSGAEEQVAALKSSIIQNAGTDEIKIVRDYGVLPTQKNLPKHKNNVLRADKYVIDIKQGFSALYKWIQNNKSLFIENIYTAFRDAQCRLIIKATYLYSNLLNTSYHPDLLQDAIHRKVYLSRIGLSKSHERLKNFLESEYMDLLNGDIPYFYTNANSKQIKNSYDKVVKGVKLLKSPLEAAKNKIDKMSTSDFEMQLDFIDLSFLYNNYEGDNALTNISFQTETRSLINRDTQSEIEDLIKIGDFIIDKAVLGEYNNRKEYTWLGLMIYGKKEQLTQISGVESDLYKGNSGIALFFAYLYDITKNHKYKNAAIQALNPVSSLIKDILQLTKKETVLEIGGFSGIGGMIYSLYHAGRHIHEEEYVSIAIQGTELLIEFSEMNEREDIISGVSGAISVVLSLYKNIDKKDRQEILLETLRRLYKRFIAILELKGTKDKIDWSKISEGYTGFAHGSSGISATMMQLYPIIQDAFILKLVASALEFERGLYSKKDKNWHIQIGDEGFSNGWCHGAPGILLNRILLKANGYDDKFIDIEIERAIETTIEKGFGNNSTLCHGDLGSLLILDYTADIMNDLSLKKYCKNTYLKIYEDTIKQVILNKNHPDNHLFGLMIGLTGYGYIMLKNLNPNLNNILWLE
ncbi:type 2 lanthipeptide synthetase LanM family protein [Bacillus sp. NSP9.1]|uniref:type 2 lanthipeptide synthetase LanM family protein n=1 Tax=Bacillus sp. NSP9.1 TaxID=1071078 RepID=UPI0003F65CD2|nr:type 2 lanthipeptide synthetase LanM family protein [Bacillus sp. NSP9.1]QHZ48132.1 type 2 lantipeptide synthetase LanM [Bacillus sp. NSP9.1]